MKPISSISAALLIASGSLFASPEGRWLDLQLEQFELGAKYRQAHPMMKAFQEELAAVHRELGDPDFHVYAAYASERLMELKLQEVDYQQRYRDMHPKLELVRQQIAFLGTIPGVELDQAAMEAKLSELNKESMAMATRYRDHHPDVEALQKQIEFLQTEIAKQPTRL